MSGLQDVPKLEHVSDIVFQSAQNSLLDTVPQEKRAQFFNCANVEMLMVDVGVFFLKRPSKGLEMP